MEARRSCQIGGHKCNSPQSTIWRRVDPVDACGGKHHLVRGEQNQKFGDDKMTYKSLETSPLKKQLDLQAKDIDQRHRELYY